MLVYYGARIMECVRGIGKGDGMRKRLLLVGVVVICAVLLGGCALLDSIFGGTTPGGGSTSSVFPVSGRMKISLAATVWQDNGYTGAHTYAGNVATTFWSGAGVPGGCFTAYTWDGGDFWGTAFIACLSQDEKKITRFEAGQVQENIWGGYTKMHSIVGANVPFSHVDGVSRYYRIEGTAARALVTALEFAMWVPGAEHGGSVSDPLEWIVGGPAALTGGADDYIEIRLDYQTQAVAP